MTLATAGRSLWSAHKQWHIPGSFRCFSVAPQSHLFQGTSKAYFATDGSQAEALDDIPAYRPLKQAYPPGPLDTSLFEALSDEYYSTPTRAPSQSNGATGHVATDANLPCEVLSRLVARDDFNGAAAAKKELEALKIPIQQDPAYIKAALHHLLSPSAENRREGFLSWAKLTPISAWRESFTMAKLHLFEHPVDLEMVIEFGLYCATNGFSTRVGNSLLPHIVRFSDPNTSQSFVNAFESAAKIHLDKEGRGNDKDWMHWRNLAIRTHALSGRGMLAAQLLSKARDDGIYIRRITYSIVVRALEEAQGTLIAERVQRLFAVDHPRETSDEHTRKSVMESSWDRRRIGTTRAPAELALTLRQLRTALRAPHPPPSASTLADFIYNYTRQGRTRALMHLRAAALARSRSVAGQWVLAEQLYYAARGRHAEGLRAFIQYCTLEGIPATRAVNTLARYDAEQKRKRSPVAIQARKLLKLPLVPMHEKLWPLRGSVHLAWKALVELSLDSELESLYASMLKHVDNTKATVDTEQKSTQAWTPAFPWKTDSVIFLPFVRRMGMRIGPQRSALVLADMRARGIPAGPEHLGAAAHNFARAGHVDRVSTVLKHIEQSTSPTVSTSAGGAAQSRRMLSIVYCGAVRGFTECGMYKAAREVVERMRTAGLLDGDVDRRTRGVLWRLARYERGAADKLLAKRQWFIQDGQRVYADPKRAFWTPAVSQ